MKGRGLTLIELLIVVGIIATLAGLILSVVHLARRAAYVAYCTNNLKQIHLALKLYEEDFGAAPFLPWDLVSYKPDIASVLICPADPTEGTKFADGYPRNWPIRCSYEFYDIEFLIPSLLKDGIWRGRDDPNPPWVLCLWHRRPQIGRRDALTVFADGSVRWWDTTIKTP